MSVPDSALPPQAGTAPSQRWPGRASLSWRLARLALMTLAYLLLNLAFAELTRHYNYGGPAIGLSFGLALAAMLCWGAEAIIVPGIGHAAFFWVVASANGSESVAGALWSAIGSMAMTAAGAGLVRRYCKTPLLLSDAREALVFLLIVGLVPSAVGSLSMASFLVIYYHFPNLEQLPGIVLDNWIYNSISLVIGTPLALTILASPRRVWAPRRLSVGAPLLAALLLLLLAFMAVSGYDAQRRAAAFERESIVAANAIGVALREPLNMLATMQVLLYQRTNETSPEVRRVAESFQSRNSAIEGFGSVLAAQRLAPSMATAVNRVAFVRALATGLPTATQGQSSDKGDKAGSEPRIVLWQAIDPGKDAAEPGETLSASDGVAFVILNPAALLAVATAQGKSGLKACLSDDDVQAASRHLAGSAGCEQRSLTQPELVQALQFGGRSWTLRLYPAEGPAIHASADAQVFALMALLGSGMLALLLLTVSGRTHQVETLVAMRTTELQDATHALRRNEQRFRSLFENAPIGIYISGLDGMPAHANPQFCLMLDCLPDELRQRYPVLVDEDAELARGLVQSGAASHTLQRVYRKPDGSETTTRVLMSLLRDAQGRPDSLLALVRDITDQLRFEANERAREAAELANRTKSEFLSHMSHELRTPLNGLLGFTQLLQLDSERTLSTQQKEWIAKIGQAGWHLLAMINDVLDLSRIETGNLKVTLEQQDVHMLVEEVKALLNSTAQKRAVTLRTQLSTLARYAIGDLTRMREILGNLLSNAIKYNVEGGVVVVSAQLVDASHIDISVTDTGPGLSSTQLASLFQPFNRLGQERGKIEGTGIGLVISRRLAELMNGSLRVGSQLGKGTTFTLRLPAADGQTEPFIPAVPSFAGADWRQRRRLAYVEDNAVNIEVMRAVIAQRPKAELAVFEDGASGLAALLADPPELLLLDMQLPDTNGLSLLRKLRVAPQCASMIVIMVSADALDEQIRDCLDAGARQYVTKPFNIRDLLSLLDELLAA